MVHQLRVEQTAASSSGLQMSQNTAAFIWDCTEGKHGKKEQLNFASPAPALPV